MDAQHYHVLLLIVLAVVVAVPLGSFLGFGIGATIGGNWYNDAQLGIWRGYEATGLMGRVIGAGLGVALLMCRRPRALLGALAGTLIAAALLWQWPLVATLHWGWVPPVVLSALGLIGK